MSRAYKAQTSASINHDGSDMNYPARRHQMRPPRWSMGILNDPTTHDVPGSILLLTENSKRPGEKNSATPQSLAEQEILRNEKKKTSDGRIILEPQPEDSYNDPLNWPLWRKDSVLFSVGFFAMLGGGTTPLLAAGFSNIATTFHIRVAQVSLTTGLYMLGLGLGSVITSPTAILFGKRPLYIIGAILFVCSSTWCALASSFTSLIMGRVLQGISVSPIECLPSATITEVYFLHERAYRIGIYSFLLLGGKNLVPLVSAAIIESYGWRWVFWSVELDNMANY
ncbi:putative MFS-type transporter [Golovinomyces cichoracearum]|uniref:Putative MFS-type transporter n=1 Tax=Golovinomyces cichoracearum TaxID=62708 RepID=A0A420IZB6_9PEZI|nr:putative MFS-type transporter [Golovinomyces cichoracearum]